MKGPEGDSVPCLSQRLVGSGNLGLWLLHSSLCRLLFRLKSPSASLLLEWHLLLDLEPTQVIRNDLISRLQLHLQRLVFQIKQPMTYSFGRGHMEPPFNPLHYECVCVCVCCRLCQRTVLKPGLTARVYVAKVTIWKLLGAGNTMMNTEVSACPHGGESKVGAREIKLFWGRLGI